MFNDLLFPLLPRNTKVPVGTDNRIQRIRRAVKSESLNPGEKEQHDSIHRVDDAAQLEWYRRVYAVVGNGERREQGTQLSIARRTGKNTKPDVTAPDETSTLRSSPRPGRKHLDEYI